jgi:hypothetical protein
MHYLGIKFPLPKTEGKVESRELTVVTNGVPKVYKLPGSATMSEEIVFAETDTYAAFVTDINEFGHRSLPSPKLKGNVAELMSPPTPGELGPLKDSNKRVLTEEDVAKLRADSDKKRAEDAKKAQEAEAKAEKDAQAVRDAHAKIDAEAEKKMALAK